MKLEVGEKTPEFASRRFTSEPKTGTKWKDDQFSALTDDKAEKAVHGTTDALKGVTDLPYRKGW